MSLAESLLEDFDEEEEIQQTEENDHAMLDIKMVDPLQNARTLLDSSELNKLCNDIEVCMENNKDNYDLVVDSNFFVMKIDEEIHKIHTEIVHLYSSRYPELASHVPNTIPFVKAVKMIGNLEDITLLDFSNFLTPAQAMAVAMTGSKLDKRLSESDLEKILNGCDSILRLDETKQDIILPFVAMQMSHLAPNVNAILGSDIAAQLLAVVGGLEQLVNIPSCNVATIGKSHESLNGFSRRTGMRHFGVIHGCSLVQDCLPEYQVKAMRVISGRLALAARMDFNKEDKYGEAGYAWRNEIRGKLEKWHKPPPGKTKRALPVPKTDSKKKRGGKRARRLKELYGLTDVQKEANRIQFGGTGDEYGDSAMGKTFGRLGQQGTGKLRVTVKEQKKLNKQHIKETPVNVRAALTNALTSTSAVPGTATNIVSSTATSVAFTPVQGIELVNPALSKERVNKANSRYFGTMKFKNNSDKSSQVK